MRAASPSAGQPWHTTNVAMIAIILFVLHAWAIAADFLPRHSRRLPWTHFAAGCFVVILPPVVQVPVELGNHFVAFERVVIESTQQKTAKRECPNQPKLLTDDRQCARPMPTRCMMSTNTVLAMRRGSSD
jgi:hypothetical protein